MVSSAEQLSAVDAAGFKKRTIAAEAIPVNLVVKFIYLNFMLKPAFIT